ncbi:hypothetical protein [Streptococcus thoraltensis]|uniref:hypothetical protein n=1 Tax=Streptococcus thoraltensis TaxID=55085 RepID=UPI0003779A7F|nr:hypothetical protein [Streptococcus thoraltensis]QBX31125.1 hypothetical protein Javan616_0032 [Streptococcus phage Javan616]
MKHKPFNLNPLIQAILIACTLLSLWVALSTTKANKGLREENKRLSERVTKLPEAFGGVGYISAVGEDYIDVVGYGRFLINEDEAQFLDKGDKVPQYILERGQ